MYAKNEKRALIKKVNSENYYYCKKRDLTCCKCETKLSPQYLGKYPYQYPIYVTLIKSKTAG
jgi:hypothetical protein